MLAIRRETDYALKLLKVLAKAKGKILSLNEVSKKTKISFLFLQKIARKLRLAEIIGAYQGVEGGYKLLIDPKKISLRTVIEAMEGKVSLLNCTKKNNKVECVNIGEKCDVKNKLSKINSKIIKILDGVKLSDI